MIPSENLGAYSTIAACATEAQAELSDMGQANCPNTGLRGRSECHWERCKIYSIPICGSGFGLG
jgi:hypothetical protein